jgi:hypothetical protein
MSWLSTICIAALTGVLGLFAAGFIGAGCVSWYRISGFEGKSGYFMAAIALLGGILGTIIGFATSRLLASGAAPGFLKGLGMSWGIVLLIGGIAALVSWMLADIPPKLNGQTLELEVEIRLPAGETNSPLTVTGDSSLTLGSVINHVQRKSESGELRIKEARFEEGRWVIPGSVSVFTMRGLRSIHAVLDGKSVGGFIVPLPARPGKKFEQWSEWEPRPPAGKPPWPASNPSYRFRIQRFVPPPPPPDPAVVKAEKFAALKPDAPLEDWLPFMQQESSVERIRAVMKVVEERPAELANLVRSTNSAIRESALSAVIELTRVTPEIRDAVLAEGRDIAEGVRAFNQMKADDPRFYDVQIQLRTRFSYWKQAWWQVWQLMGLDGGPPVQEIHDLALARSKDTTMDEIVVNARTILDALKPAPARAP